jgi:hypothetical protein
VRCLSGALLLGAAGLKAYALATDPFAQDSPLLSPRLLIATIQVETLLGLWLVSGWAPRAARLAGIGFFLILAGSSLYLALEGQPSCGCLGRVTVSPWLTFALDTAVVAALLLLRPAPGFAIPTGGLLRASWPIALGTMLILVLTAGLFLLAVEDPEAALARLRGEPITVEPSRSWVGERPAWEEETFTILLRNHGNARVRIYGGTADCACIVTRDLPVTVPPHESRPISVQVMFKGPPGLFQRRFLPLHGREESIGCVGAFRRPRVARGFALRGHPCGTTRYEEWFAGGSS